MSFSRVLFSGAGGPYRVMPIFNGAIEDDSGSHHPDRFLHFLRNVLTTNSDGITRRVLLHCRGGLRFTSSP